MGSPPHPRCYSVRETIKSPPSLFDYRYHYSTFQQPPEAKNLSFASKKNPTKMMDELYLWACVYGAGWAGGYAVLWCMSCAERNNIPFLHWP